MLARVLEPEVMDSEAEARDYDAMDHAAVNSAFVDDFLAAWDGQGPVLDVGTGTAQIPIELCRRHPSVQVTAFDLAEHMLTVARANVARAGLQDRVRPRRCDAKRLPFAGGEFGLPAVLILKRLPEGERHSKAELNAILRDHGVDG